MPYIRRWFINAYYIGFMNRLEKSIIKYLLNKFPKQLNTEIIMNAKENIVNNMDETSMDPVVLFFRVMKYLRIDDSIHYEKIKTIGENEFIVLGETLLKRVPENTRNAFHDIIKDKDQTIKERAERIIAGLDVDHKKI